MSSFGKLTNFFRRFAVLGVCLGAAAHGLLPAGFASESTPAHADEPAAIRPHGGMMRYPDCSAEHVVFVYGNDLWLVPRAGGVALPLSSPAGQEMHPKFSPDGRTVAFVANYDGNQDLYAVPVEGGAPARVTHHPAAEVLCDVLPDGRLLFSTNGLAPMARQTELYYVAAKGGLAEKLPVPYGANGAVSADGRFLAYTPHSIDQRTWKRYRGGMATDIWIVDLKDGSSKRITDWEGTDTLPMWQGSTVYYLSDAGDSHRLNIWSYNTESGAREQITKFADYDVKWPSIGPGPAGKGEIVFQHGPSLDLLDLESRQSKAVDVRIPGDRPKLRRRMVDEAKNIMSSGISSTGKRGVFEARGDIWTVPAENGSPRNLTRTDGVAERDPAWSPDGRWIAYFSDATGEYELYLASSAGQGEARRLTHDGGAFRYDPTWSPDSKHIALWDKGGALFVHTIDGETKKIDTHPWAEHPRVRWSHDSAWLAYTKEGDNRKSAIWLYHLSEGKAHQVTAGRFDDGSPVFDRKGDYLFLTSSRQFSAPVYEDAGTTFVYAGTELLLAVPLRAAVGVPRPPKSDEETWGDEKKKKDEDKDKKDADKKPDDKPAEDKAADKKDESAADEKSGEKEKRPDEAAEKKEDKDAKPLEIELDGFERRAIVLPVKAGNFAGLEVTSDGKLVYTARAPRGGRGEPAIKILDIKADEKQEQTVVEGAGSFSISADGKKLLVRKGDTYAIVDAKADQKLTKSLSTKGLQASIDPRAEWRQMLREAWRLERDYFYDPNMHGVNWPTVLEQYQKMLDDCTSREDVQYVIGEMISELNVGHTYARTGGDMESPEKVSVGMLGVDYERGDGAYRIARIYEGAPWDADARGPLSQPGVDCKPGDYLLAVNGVPVDPEKDPWAACQGLAGKTITITVSQQPTRDEKSRTLTIVPLAEETELRYRAWIERNRAYVAERSGGRIGYLHVPDTGVNGQNELFRQFHGQTAAAALIIDERWNGGGQIPTRFIELLNRPVTNYWARRDGNDWTWPADAHHGPKCMLINGLSGSGGDAFPAYFRQAGLGKLIGTRTWGGLVGISGNPLLIDGGQVTVPTFAFYETDGTWGIEGHGVDPDIEVVDDPAKMRDGRDPQLDAAIEHMLAQLERAPYKRPNRPAYPNRAGMGIAPADK
ncbi:MAG: PDZ domain-containing protein [Planctomycetia bacterium]|nr:PDZ domain-containing protein [Planctomycetia bacterium]